MQCTLAHANALTCAFFFFDVPTGEPGDELVHSPSLILAGIKFGELLKNLHTRSHISFIVHSRHLSVHGEVYMYV